MRVYLADHADMDSLCRWLAEVPGVHAEPVSRPARPGEQGGVWDFLSVLFGTGGAVAVTVNALTTWIESRMTHARIVIGDTEVELRGSDPEALERLITAAGRAAASGEVTSGS
jgi:hypothetical protein